MSALKEKRMTRGRGEGDVEKGRKTGFREETQRKRGITREDYQNNLPD